MLKEAGQRQWGCTGTGNIGRSRGHSTEHVCSVEDNSNLDILIRVLKFCVHFLGPLIQLSLCYVKTKTKEKETIHIQQGAKSLSSLGVLLNCTEKSHPRPAHPFPGGITDLAGLKGVRQEFLLPLEGYSLELECPPKAHVLKVCSQRSPPEGW